MYTIDTSPTLKQRHSVQSASVQQSVAMGGVDTFGGKHPTMGSQHAKHKRSTCTLIPFRALGIILCLQLLGCLIISLYYLRSANREIVWLVKALYDQGMHRWCRW